MVSSKYEPPEFKILHEDQDIIVGNKLSGFLTVAALWNKTKTIHDSVNNYIRKGSSHSKKSVYVVHRLDQYTTGVLMFAKSEKIQFELKEDWAHTIKTYYAIVHGKMKQKSGLFSSYLFEDEDYVVHSSPNSAEGKLAQTEFKVVKETAFFSVVKINLLTGKKNQIRVHFADAGHPVVGDLKYGKNYATKHKDLMLHAFSVVFTHPTTRERLRVQADVPAHFLKLINYSY